MNFPQFFGETFDDVKLYETIYDQSVKIQNWKFHAFCYNSDTDFLI